MGNYFGAMRPAVKLQEEGEAFYFIADYHAMTSTHDSAELRENVRGVAVDFLACGLDPERTVLFVQSLVPEHNELYWILGALCSYGDLTRMTQFKDKSALVGEKGGKFVSSGLFTYPVLQAADILLYDTNEVPVGDDQRQHIEITRDIAERFNSHYGETFVLPEAVIPAAGARVMDLQQPTNKMSKSLDSPKGTIGLLDEPKQIEKKVKSAVTDTDGEVRFDIEAKPGVSNLLSILGAATDRDPASLADQYEQYGPLKMDTAEALIALLEPIQARYRELESDPGETARLLKVGADKAREIASATMTRVRHNIGLLAD